VTGVKLAAPADRIGLGLVAYPTDNLSPGHVPMPHHPEPEQVRSRALSAMQPRMRWQGDDGAATPAGSAGWLPGVSAVRSASATASRFSGRRSTRMAASGRTDRFYRLADLGRTRVPGNSCRNDRLDDCQSSDRSSDKRIAKRDASLIATAGK